MPLLITDSQQGLRYPQVAELLDGIDSIPERDTLQNGAPPPGGTLPARTLEGVELPEQPVAPPQDEVGGSMDSPPAESSLFHHSRDSCWHRIALFQEVQLEEQQQQPHFWASCDNC